MYQHFSKWVAACFAVALATAGAAAAKNGGARAGGTNASDMKFATIPGLPTCLHGSVQTGDPMGTSFILLGKGDAGCTVPWHWHTANEHLMIVDGKAQIALRSVDQGKPTTLSSGGFALLPATKVHQFRCEGACEFYLYSDGKFDIHYVDSSGNEISPDQALQHVNEVPAVAK